MKKFLKSIWDLIVIIFVGAIIFLSIGVSFLAFILI